MYWIKLLDARRGLSEKCRELFGGDETIANAIYRFLCDGLEECDFIELNDEMMSELEIHDGG